MALLLLFCVCRDKCRKNWRNFLYVVFSKERENAFKWRGFNISSKHNRKNQWNENSVPLVRLMADSVIHISSGVRLMCWCDICRRRHYLRLILICFSTPLIFFHVYSSFNNVNGRALHNSSFDWEPGSSPVGCFPFVITYRRNDSKIQWNEWKYSN